MSLRTKLVLFSIIIALIPLGTSGIILIRITRDELKSSANENLIAVASQLALEIEDFYRYTWLAPLDLIRKSLENDRLGVNEKMAILTEGMQSIKDFVVFQISVEGVQAPMMVIQNAFAEKLLNLSLDPQATLKISSNELLSYKMNNSSFSGYIRFVEPFDSWLLTVIYELDYRTFGTNSFFSARIDLKRLKERIDNHPFHHLGEIYVINSNGTRLFDVNQSDLTKYQIVHTAMGILAGSSRSVGALPYTRDTGEKMLGAFAFPIGIDMAVIVEQNEKDAYLAVNRMELSLLSWIFFGIFVASVGAIVVSVSLTRPLLRLTKAARQISQGDLTVIIKGQHQSDEIGELSTAFNKMIVDLRHYIDQLTETTKARERVESELKLARDIQQSFLPKSFPESDEIEVWGRCESAREVGGDYYDFFKIDEDRYGIAIGDVSGKGMPAALFMAVSRTLFRILTSQILEPDKVLTEFNNRLVSLDQNANMFITMFYGVYDRKSGQLLYSTAGHQLPYLVKKDKETVSVTSLDGMKTMVAGIIDGISMHLGKIHLQENDAIVLYTDGMTEAINHEEKEFGEKKFQEIIGKYSHFSVRQWCDHIIEEVQSYQSDMPQFDDMTLLILKIRSKKKNS